MRYDDNMRAVYSVKDIVSHPGYDEYIVNTTANDVERMRRILTVYELSLIHI